MLEFTECRIEAAYQSKLWQREPNKDKEEKNTGWLPRWEEES